MRIGLGGTVVLNSGYYGYSSKARFGLFGFCGTEWVGPYNDYFAKFHEAAKYYYTGECLAWWRTFIAFNASFGGSLSVREKAVLTTCL